MKVHQLFLVFILALFPVKLFATAQVPDRIIWEGKTYSLLCNPLGPYFQEYPDKRPQGGFSTALWRGYVATFEIINNQLYLTEIITDPFAEYREDSISLQKNLVEEIFPGQKKVKVDWFTGLLVIPRGRMINYVHMGYSSPTAGIH